MFLSGKRRVGALFERHPDLDIREATKELWVVLVRRTDQSAG